MGMRQAERIDTRNNVYAFNDLLIWGISFRHVKFACELPGICDHSSLESMREYAQGDGAEA
jgi:hypothetical protein